MSQNLLLVSMTYSYVCFTAVKFPTLLNNNIVADIFCPLLLDASVWCQPIVCYHPPCRVCRWSRDSRRTHANIQDSKLFINCLFKRQFKELGVWLSNLICSSQCVHAYEVKHYYINVKCHLMLCSIILKQWHECNITMKKHCDIFT